MGRVGQGLGFRVWGYDLRFMILGLWCKVYGLRFTVHGLGSKGKGVHGAGYRAKSLGFGVWGSGFSGYDFLVSVLRFRV